MNAALHITEDDGQWISWMGAPTRFLIIGKKTNHLYCLSIGVSAVDGSAPPHRHDFEEGFYLLSGSVTFVAGNQEITLEAGDFINIGANTSHYIKNESGSPAELLTICTPAGFDRFQMEGGYPMDSKDDALVPFSDEGIDRVKAAAKKYGIDLDPPGSSFQKSAEPQCGQRKSRCPCRCSWRSVSVPRECRKHFRKIRAVACDYASQWRPASPSAPS